MKYFTADLHLGHANILKYCNRPFDNTDEMDAVISNNIFETLDPHDELYIVGDLTFDERIAADFFAVLQGTCRAYVHYIWGNHDKGRVRRAIKDVADSVHERMYLKINERKIVLDHFAGRVWRDSHFGSWQLYGHTHAGLKPKGKQYDVGVDNNDFQLVSLDQVIEIMETLPENENFIPKDKRRPGK